MTGSAAAIIITAIVMAAGIVRFSHGTPIPCGQTGLPEPTGGRRTTRTPRLNKPAHRLRLAGSPEHAPGGPTEPPRAGRGRLTVDNCALGA